jgi:hypothetical protein
MTNQPSHHAVASSSSLCCRNLIRALGVEAPAAFNGKSLSVHEMLRHLRTAGVRPTLEICQSLEELSVAEDAAGTIAFVDAGALWDWKAAISISVPNHAVRLLKVERASQDGEVTAVLVEDPLRPDKPVRLDVELLLTAWLRAGGTLLVVADRNRAKKYDV